MIDTVLLFSSFDDMSLIPLIVLVLIGVAIYLLYLGIKKLPWVKLRGFRKIMKSTENFLQDLYDDTVVNKGKYGDVYSSRTIIIDRNIFSLHIFRYEGEEEKSSLMIHVEPPNHSHTTDNKVSLGTKMDHIKWMRTVKTLELKRILDRMNRNCNLFYWP